MNRRASEGWWLLMAFSCYYGGAVWLLWIIVLARLASLGFVLWMAAPTSREGS